MNLTDDAKRFKDCLEKHPENIFVEINKEVDTYWEDKEMSACMYEYGFDTPIEMLEMLKPYIEDQELKQIIVAASFKRRNEYVVRKDSDKKGNSDNQLPEFVYAF